MSPSPAPLTDPCFPPLPSLPSLPALPAASAESAPGIRRTSLQEREVHRYYEPWLSAHGSSVNVANKVESLARPHLHGGGYRARASRDKALTGFAQLACLKLNVKRGMVSLIDSRNQYILAEASKTTSVNDDADLWLGTAVLNRPDAMCEHCFQNRATGRDGDGKTKTIEGLVIDDCRLDDRFKDRPYVVSDPGVRFYAGVPILSRSGIKIGAYAVSDEHPRDGLRVDELVFMQETAVAIMEHLEWARDRVDRFKGDRIVRGMASFIEGCTSLQEGAPEDPLRSSADDEKAQHSQAERPSLPSSPSAAPHAPVREARTPSKRPTAPIRSKSGRIDSSANMFARAAGILRESLLADGAAIFGATARASHHGRSSHLAPPEQATPGNSGGTDATPPPTGESGGPDHQTSDSNASPNARPCRVLACALEDERYRAEIERGSTFTLGTLEKYFTLYPRGKVFNFTHQGVGLSSEDEGSSSDSANHHRDTDGHATTAPGSTASHRHNRKGNGMDHRELLKNIPGAQIVIFLPLYDFVEEKLLAGVFLWTSATGRMINMDDDLSYLRAFGNSIMSEAARLNVQRNEAAKTTFIASISHELRSPLHGILGAVEFLVDTATDSYQAGLISSIATCGKTLLDTLNHVLDYSKINKLGRTQMRRNAKQSLVNLASDSSLESLNMTAEVDLGILVEEVVEAVTAGHTFKKLQSGSILSKAPAGQRQQREEKKVVSVNDLSGGKDGGDDVQDGSVESEASVNIMLDISPRRSWLVRTQPGALRRIIMNLLGNALKYTAAGFVAVSLRAAPNPSKHGNKVEAAIRVVDSGKGMSEEFQRTRLFVPFSQEDSFQPGTGLGLSIVKEIVDSLRGNVEVKSRLGVGTEVDVLLSITPAESQPHGSGGILRADDVTKAMLGKAKGLHLVLLDACRAPRQTPALRDRTARLQTSFREVCEHWFEMRVTVSEGQMDHEDADVYLYAEPPSVELLIEKAKNGRLRRRDSGKIIPVIIICLDGKEALQVGKNVGGELNELGTIVEVIPQPCGPRKMARVLGHCLERVAAAAAAHDSEGARAMLKDDAAAIREADAHERLQQIATTTPSAEATATSPSGTRPPQSRLARHGKSYSPTSSSFTSADLPPPSTSVAFPSPPPLDLHTPSLRHVPRNPISEPDSRSSVHETSGGNSSGSALHVLLVDDNDINLHLLTMFMKKAGYTYATASNGREALDAYTATHAPAPSSSSSSSPSSSSTGKRKFDYILMDISMPIMSGLKSTKRIREFEHAHGLQRCCVIALTGLASTEAQREAETAGVDVFLPKPVKFAELRRLLVVR